MTAKPVTAIDAEHNNNRELVKTGNSKSSVTQKIAFGFGGISENLMSNIVLILAMPIYSIALGVDAALIGLALALPRLWDAFTDPLIGNISDNTRSKWGRRKPYIFFGAILAGVFNILMWMPPSGASPTFLFWYLLVVSILFFTAFAIFDVPYVALGYELADDYDERTKVMSYKVFTMSVGGMCLLPFAYRMCFLPFFGNNEIQGVRIVGLILGFFIILCGIMPVFFCKERVFSQPQDKIPISKALFHTFGNKAFLMMAGVVFATIAGYFLAQPLLLYVNIAYIYAGNKESAATMMGIVNTTYCILGFVSVPLVSYLAVRWGKKETLIMGLVCICLAFSLSWWYFNPRYPYLQIIFSILAAPGTACLWIITMSCVADICDLDECKTGLRREGVYGAVYAWFMKLGLTAVLAISGFVIRWSGFQSGLLQQKDSTIFYLRLMYACLPVVFLFIAIGLVLAYPINKQKVKEIQMQLAEKRRRSPVALNV